MARSHRTVRDIPRHARFAAVIVTSLAASACRPISSSAAENLARSHVTAQRCLYSIVSGPQQPCGHCADRASRCPDLLALERLGWVSLDCRSDITDVEFTPAGLAVSTPSPTNSIARDIVVGVNPRVSEVVNITRESVMNQPQAMVQYNFVCDANDAARSLRGAGIGDQSPYGLPRHFYAFVSAPLATEPLPVHRTPDQHSSHPYFR